MDGASLGLRTDVVATRRAVGLAERVAACDERHRLLVVHRHASERLTDVARRSQRIRVPIRAFRVDVDEAHLDGSERTGELAVAAVALVAEPLVLEPPEHLLRLPDVLATEGEAE